MNGTARNVQRVTGRASRRVASPRRPGAAHHRRDVVRRRQSSSHRVRSSFHSNHLPRVAGSRVVPSLVQRTQPLRGTTPVWTHEMRHPALLVEWLCAGWSLPAWVLDVVFPVCMREYRRVGVIPLPARNPPRGRFPASEPRRARCGSEERARRASETQRQNCEGSEVWYLPFSHRARVFYGVQFGILFDLLSPGCPGGTDCTSWGVLQGLLDPRSLGPRTDFSGPEPVVHSGFLRPALQETLHPWGGSSALDPLVGLFRVGSPVFHSYSKCFCEANPASRVPVKCQTPFEARFTLDAPGVASL